MCGLFVSKKKFFCVKMVIFYGESLLFKRKCVILQAENN